MSYNSGIIRLVISNQPRVTRLVDLKLLARLHHYLPLSVTTVSSSPLSPPGYPRIPRPQGLSLRSKRFRAVTEQGPREKWLSPSPLFHFLALVSFLARPKPRISFLGLSLLRNSRETLATQATGVFVILKMAIWVKQVQAGRIDVGRPLGGRWAVKRADPCKGVMQSTGLELKA